MRNFQELQHFTCARPQIGFFSQIMVGFQDYEKCREYLLDALKLHEKHWQDQGKREAAKYFREQIEAIEVPEAEQQFLHAAEERAYDA